MALGVIPARYASTRFPGKPLAALGDRTLVEEVWRRVRSARRIARVVVATEDERVADAARAFGAEVLLTDAAHPSGTDRVAEVARRLGGGHAIVVNVQGDEPLVTPTCLERLVEALETDPALDMATLAEPITSVEELFDPNVVKVVTDLGGRALYFSRAPIPYHRGGSSVLASDFRAALSGRVGGLRGYSKHQGLYAYRLETLLELAQAEPSPLERDEGLEQLRALESGRAIRVLDSDFRSQAVDTPADLDRVNRLLAAR